MAKSKARDLGGFFKPTEPQPQAEAPAEDLAQETPVPPATGPGQPLQQRAERSAPATREVDRTLPVGVGLKASELARLDAIAAELGIARNALMRFAVAHFLQDYREGRVTVNVETKETRRIVMP